MTEAPALTIEHPGGWDSLPHRSMQRIKDGLLAFSLANLFFIRPWFAALYDYDFGYFNKVRVTDTTLLALLTSLSWFSVLSWLVLQARRRWQNRWFRMGLNLIFLALLLVPLDFCRSAFTDYTMADVLANLRKHGAATLAVLVVAIVFWQHRRVARAAAVLVGILSPLACLIVARILLLLCGLQHLAQHQAEPALPTLRHAPPNQPRILWLIFDETDQRLAFEQRPAGVELPEFDRLRAQSLEATNAWSPGHRTLLSMPALISGTLLSSADVRDASDLKLVIADTHASTNWSQLPSVFESARALGVNTALVGWYHPYRRVLARSLNFCEWYPGPEYEPTRGPTFGGTVLRQILCPSGPFHQRHIYIGLCRAALAQSLMLVTNSTYGLTLLHLPPPHRPGIYNPKTGGFSLSIRSESTQYFDNLALADRILGALRNAMELCGLWDNTWIILSADHSWRWSNSYDGRKDPRVPFIVKTPGQHSPLTYSPGMNTILTHDLILAILKGEVHDAAALSSWLDSHRSEAEMINDRPDLYP